MIEIQRQKADKAAAKSKKNAQKGQGCVCSYFIYIHIGIVKNIVIKH